MSIETCTLPLFNPVGVACARSFRYNYLNRGLHRFTRKKFPRSSRYDSEYKRNGVSNLFMIFAPLQGFGHVEVTDQRTSLDFAHICRDLVDVHFRDAEKILLVCDNLNTHKPASLYKAFPPDEARRIAEKLEFHYTPKHGSWLNIAESELSVLSRQGLCRRIADQATLKHEIQTWQDRRNQQRATLQWQFTTDDARIKLKTLYPAV